jgi:hypothetical protein
MDPVNNILNYTNALNTDRNAGFFKKQIAPRVINLVVGTPTEVVAIGEKILLAPFQAAGAVLQLAVKPISWLSGSQAIKNFENKLPNFTNLLKTIARIVAYTIGTALTATVGFLAPHANFRAHCALGLAYDKQAYADFKRSQLMLQAQLNEQTIAKEAAQAVELAAKAAEEKARAEEQEILNHLAPLYTLADELAIEKEESIIEKEESIIEDMHYMFDETAVQAKEIKIEELDEAVEEKKEELAIVFEEEAEIARSFAGKAINASKNLANSAYNTVKTGVTGTVSLSKVSLINTFNAVAHPVETSKKAYQAVIHPIATTTNTYHYVRGFFAAQKA